VKLNALESAATVESRMATMKGHFGERALMKIRTADVEDFLVHLRQPSLLAPGRKTERTRMPATVNRYRSQLVQMFNWAVSRDYLERSPFSKGGQTLIHAMQEDNKRDRRLSSDEKHRLVATAAPHVKLFMTAALYSGMQQGEMLALTWADATDRSGWSRLRGTTTKSGKTPWIPIHPNVQAVLHFLRTDANGDEKPADGPVFSNEVGEAMVFPKTAWKLALRRVKITNFRWHDLRHEFASRLVGGGTPLPQCRNCWATPVSSRLSATTRTRRTDCMQRCRDCRR
jgi:integrase